ncbi:MAG: hypothetical protein GX929_02625 [Clostridiales bacterium]|jgi:pyruvate kinase|nr:hypothetical protein [Clostridiales bacterium]
MIIPTLRISQNPNDYKSLIRVCEDNTINTIRVNISRYNPCVYEKHIQIIRELSSLSLDIMLDLPIPGCKNRLALGDKEEINVYADLIYGFAPLARCNKGEIPVQLDSIDKSIVAGDEIIIGDGEASFVIEERNEEVLYARALHNANLRGKRAFLITGFDNFHVCSDKESATLIASISQIKPKYVVLSFSESVLGLLHIEKTIHRILGTDCTIIPKIETRKGIDNLYEIFMHYPIAMLGRGDLALSNGLERFAENQNDALLKSMEIPKARFIVATDILTSLYLGRVPSRADLTDLFYLHSMEVSSIVASAGLSLSETSFRLFCRYANVFNTKCI